MSRFQPTQSKYYSDFTPVVFGDCALWLDAADSSTLTLSGSSVIAWADKSGNGKNATGGVSPTYLNSGVVFDGTQYLDTSYTAVPSAETVFAVATITGSTDTRNYFIIAPTNLNERGYTVNLTTGVYSIRWDKGGVASYTPTSGVQQNTRFLTSGTYTGSAGTTGLNGGNQSASASFSFSGTGTTKIGAFPLYLSVTSWVGTINEIIIFNSVLSILQRQQVEGYLAWKWGLRANLPATHPYSTIIPVTRPFNPLDISGCNLWLDAADSDSFEFSSSNSITRWRDKSGLGLDASQSVISNEPFWSNNQVRINGSNNWLFSDATLPLANHAIFLVHDPSNNALFNNRALSYQRAAGSDRIIFPYALDSNTPRGYFNGAAGLDGVTTLVREFSIPGQLNLVQVNTRTGSQIAYNAGIVTASSNRAITNNANSSNLTVGSGQPNNVTEVYNGGINEIITYGKTLSDGERRLVEGYLARKWGLSYLLPGTNSNLLPPTSVPGCALWLDAADSSTIDLSGSTVVRWRDKSGNNRDASGGVPPMYTSNAINGLNAITFNGSNTFLRTTDVYSLREFSIFTVIQRLASNTGNLAAPNSIIGGQTQSNNSNITIGWAGSTQLRFAFYNNDLAFTTFPAYTSPDPVYLINCSFVLRSRRIIVNGTSAAYDSNRTYIQSATGLTLGVYNNAFFNGNIAEYIVYNGSLLDRDRRQIEGYLATKWNIPGIQSQHAFKILPTLNTPFNPRDIPSCLLWLDAHDTASMTFSDSTITAWNDKSGNGRNFTSSSSPVLGTWNGRQIVDATGRGFFSNTSFVLPATYSVFAVGYSPTTTDFGGFLYAVPDFVFMMRRSSNETSMVYLKGDRTRWSTFAGGSTTTTSNSIWGVVNNVAAGTGTLYANGIPLQSNANVTTNTSTGLYIGTVGTTNTSNSWRGYFGDILIYGRGLSSVERQRVEGYLAWKWGLQPSLSLPTAASNATIVPSTITSPLDISGCGLWLDATDVSTLTLSESNVTTWADKSGNGRNATGVNNPIYTTSNVSLNGTNSYFTVNLDWLSNVNHYAFIVCSNTNYVNIYGALTGGAGARSLHVGFSSSTAYRMNYWFLDYNPTITSNYKVGQRNLLNFQWINNGSRSIYANAGFEGITNTSGSIGTMNGGGVIGNVVGQGFFRGTLNEIIFFTGSNFTDLNRQQIEKYLMDKWGLSNMGPQIFPTGNLTSPNPYKTISPI